MAHANILLPSWHLEDISRDLNEQEAAAILNAYGLALHPWVTACCFSVPRWSAAPSPGEIEKDRIVILPEPSRSKLPAGWLAQAQEQGVIVLSASSDREQSLVQLMNNARLRELLQEQNTHRPSGAAYQLDQPPACQDDFVALGTVYVLTLLLSQAMYHYDNIDETRFSDYLLEAGRAALSQQTDQVQDLLKLTCEQLLESREKFYPVDAHLIDLCLLGEGVKAEDLQQLLACEHMVNVLATAEFTEKLGLEIPEMMPSLRQALTEKKLSLLGGEYGEAPTPLLPLQSLRWQLEQGGKVYREQLGVEPAVWMRMRYGLSTQLPLMLRKFGMQGAYHLVLDDGTYPDEEQSHFSWEGRSSQVIPSISRIPLSVENATSLLRIPERMAEAMNHDHLACIVLARWPKLKNPWFQDVIRIQNFAPVLGRFGDLATFLKETEDSGHYTSHDQRHYLSPILDQLTGRKQTDPISRFTTFWQVEQRLRTLGWLESLCQILMGKPAPAGRWASLETELQMQATDLSRERLQTLRTEVEETIRSASEQLVKLLTAGGPQSSGYVILNPLAQARSVVVRLPITEQGGTKLIPRLAGAVKHVQVEEEQVQAVVELPSSGFAAVELMPLQKFRPPKEKAPLAGEHFLQNEFFHVQIDPETGGIQRLRVHGSTENLLSQRLVFRLDGTAGTVPRSAASWGQTSPEPTYTRMVADNISTLTSGPVQGQILVQGRLLAAEGDKLYAEFEQRITIQRGSRNLKLELELKPRILPTVLADRSYYAFRFAWAASAARVTGTLQQSQFPIGEKRLESTGPIQIVDENQRITLLPHFRPFHQRTAPRMIDSLLVVHGESDRTFTYDVAVNAPLAAGAGDDVASPPIVLPVDQLPRSASAWLFHVSAPSVQLLQVQREEVPTEQAGEPSGPVYRFDFIETEGKHAVVKFSTFRQPRQAWEVDFRGQIQAPLSVEGDQIVFECLPCDYLSVRVAF